MDEHYDMKEKQREHFNHQRKNLQPNQLLVVIDYKQNLIVGRKPVEISHDFRQRRQRTVLGMAVYQHGSNPTYHDIITDVNTKKSWLACVKMYDVLKETIENTTMFINNIIVWADVGNHFRFATLLRLVGADQARKEENQ